MHICYIDESGDSQAINAPGENKQPLLVLAGLLVDASKINRITDDFIRLKRRYYPAKFANINHSLDVLLKEVKGSDIRTDIRNNKLNSPLVQHHFHFLDDVLTICREWKIKLVARVWVKDFGKPIQDKSVYTISTQNIAKRFEAYLKRENSRGMIVADFRDPARNRYVAHSIFTQKHKLGQGGDAFPSIEETAVFGISDNHACLQITDLICSCLLAPIAGRIVCSETFHNAHTHPHYDWIVDRYSKRLKGLAFNCSINGRKLLGITVKDPHSKKTSIFREPKKAATPC